MGAPIKKNTSVLISILSSLAMLVVGVVFLAFPVNSLLPSSVQGFVLIILGSLLLLVNLSFLNHKK